MIGPWEVITIELPAFVLGTRSDGVSILIIRFGRHRLLLPRSKAGAEPDSQKAEDDLLVELTEQRDPKLSWKQIRKHFPNRTKASPLLHATKITDMTRSGVLSDATNWALVECCQYASPLANMGLYFQTINARDKIGFNTYFNPTQLCNIADRSFVSGSLLPRTRADSATQLSKRSSANQLCPTEGSMNAWFFMPVSVEGCYSPLRPPSRQSPSLAPVCPWPLSYRP